MHINSLLQLSADALKAAKALKIDLSTATPEAIEALAGKFTASNNLEYLEITSFKDDPNQAVAKALVIFLRKCHILRVFNFAKVDHMPSIDSLVKIFKTVKNYCKPSYINVNIDILFVLKTLSSQPIFSLTKYLVQSSGISIVNSTLHDYTEQEWREIGKQLYKDSMDVIKLREGFSPPTIEKIKRAWSIFPDLLQSLNKAEEYYNSRSFEMVMRYALWFKYNSEATIMHVLQNPGMLPIIPYSQPEISLPHGYLASSSSESAGTATTTAMPLAFELSLPSEGSSQKMGISYYLDGKFFEFDILLCPEDCGSLNNLEYIKLNGKATHETISALQEFIKKCPNLKYLNMKNCLFVNGTQNAIHNMLSIQSIQHLDVATSFISFIAQALPVRITNTWLRSLITITIHAHITTDPWHLSDLIDSLKVLEQRLLNLFVASSLQSMTLIHGCNELAERHSEVYRSLCRVNLLDAADEPIKEIKRTWHPILLGYLRADNPALRHQLNVCDAYNALIKAKKSTTNGSIRDDAVRKYAQSYAESMTISRVACRKAFAAPLDPAFTVESSAAAPTSTMADLELFDTEDFEMMELTWQPTIEPQMVTQEAAKKRLYSGTSSSASEKPYTDAAPRKRKRTTPRIQKSITEYTRDEFIPAPIDDKYLDQTLPVLGTLTRQIDDEGADLTIASKTDVDKSCIFINFAQANAAIDAAGAAVLRSTTIIRYADAHLSFHSTKEIPQAQERVIFIHAGRKAAALYPKAVACRIIFVATAAEYAEYLPLLPDDIDVLVINALNSRTHGDYADVLGALNTRRLAALIFSHYAQLQHSLCLDDNIKQINFNSTILADSEDCEIETIYDFFLLRSQDPNYGMPVLQGVHTVRTVEFDDDQPRFGAKIHFWDLHSVFAKLSIPEQLHFTAYPAPYSKYWGEDYLQQLMLRQLFHGEERLPFTVIPSSIIDFHRASKLKSLCKKSVLDIRHLRDHNLLDSVKTVRPGDAHLRGFAGRCFANISDIVRDNLLRYEDKVAHLKHTDLMQLHAQLNGLTNPGMPFDSGAIAEYEPLVHMGPSFKETLDLNRETFAAVLKPHQMQAIAAFLATPSLSGYMRMATGSGKTYLQMALALAALQMNTGRPVTIITSTQNLVEQFYQDFMQALPRFNAHAPAPLASPCEIIKVMSTDTSISLRALALNQELKGKNVILIYCLDSYLKMMAIEDPSFWLKKSALILADEFHYSYSEEDVDSIHRQAVIKANCSLLAFSATPPPETKLNHLYTYSLKDSILDGHVASLKLNRFDKKYSKDGVKHFIDHVQSYLTTTEHPMGGKLSDHKVLIYLPSIKHIKQISALLNSAGMLHYQIHSHNNRRERELADFIAGGEDVPRIILACEMLGVGYSDKDLDTVIYLRRGKDENEVLQAAGRVVRVQEVGNANNKIGLFVCFKNAKVRALQAVQGVRARGLTAVAASSAPPKLYVPLYMSLDDLFRFDSDDEQILATSTSSSSKDRSWSPASTFKAS